jgi:hypothetical protein
MVLMGTANGRVIKFDESQVNDYESTAFELELSSQDLGSRLHRRSLREIEIEAEIPVAGTVVLEQSKDESTWQDTKTISASAGTTPQNLWLRNKMVAGRELFWRVRSTARNFKLLSWWARIEERGLRRGGKV